MPPMAEMHKHVHQRTRQQQKDRKRSKEVAAMLTQQKVSGNRAKHQQTQRVSGTPKWWRGDGSGNGSVIVIVIH